MSNASQTSTLASLYGNRDATYVIFFTAAESGMVDLKLGAGRAQTCRQFDAASVATYTHKPFVFVRMSYAHDGTVILKAFWVDGRMDIPKTDLFCFVI